MSGWNFKHPHHPSERCLRHGAEGVFKVNVDSINSLTLSPSFLLDKCTFCMLMPTQRVKLFIMSMTFDNFVQLLSS